MAQFSLLCLKFWLDKDLWVLCMKLYTSFAEYTFFYKKPLCKQPSTRQPKIYEHFRTRKTELKILRQIAY